MSEPSAREGATHHDEGGKERTEGPESDHGRVKAINAAKGALRDTLAKVSRDVVACTAAELQGQGVRFASDGHGGEEAYHRASWSIPDPEAISGVTAVSVDLHPEKNHPLLK
jgi:hypothetical protein